MPPTHDRVAPARSRPVQARGRPGQPRGWPGKALRAGEEAGGFVQGNQVRVLSGPRMQAPFPEAWPRGGCGGAFPLDSGRLARHGGLRRFLSCTASGALSGHPQPSPVLLLPCRGHPRSLAGGG